ncbi:MAG: phosphate/phosphite/phosphonate ABC transporter substrate-binding protein [Desulfotignum sp.]|nr:phosphate/phosphite/phosphonate ABC transporter substrate-binding protein [Desulfotignum sp.]
MHKKIILILIFVLCFFTLALADSYKLAVYPSNDPKKLIVPMKIMADYLTGKSGDSFTAIVTRDYEELSERLKNKSVHIAWINPINYIKIKAENPSLKYIATYMEKNEETGKIIPYYQSFIVSLKTSGINTISEAKGMTFAFTDPGSTSGYAFPNLMLRQKNIVPDTFFKKVFFLKKHDRVIEALVNGSIDIGGVSDGTYYTAVRKYGGVFSIIEKSDPIPLDAIVAPENVPADKLLIYRKALTDMPENHPFNKSMRENLGWNAAGFDIKDDQFYNSMREALK